MTFEYWVSYGAEICTWPTYSCFDTFFLGMEVKMINSENDGKSEN